ncbi:hypothetical protein [Comamonas thiooxydans]|uniref:hypothetical protein n=1 Tax=Comamonas thiooxydans TaxID=363952 RepID=UPI001C254AB2|nr:hypothetical protein [Comamonas thiooxydans]
MQDNIPNALIAAFERHYDCSWDTPALRNERLAMRYGWAAAEAGRRLEPPTDSEIETVFARLPGGAQGFLKEWGYLQFAREILEMAPAMQSQCLHQIQEPAAAEQAAWHAGLDEGRAQAAPAAVAVPDGWKLVPTEPTPQMCHVGRYGGDKDAPAYGEKPVEGETAWPFVADHTAKQIYCAMLAAAPALAATPAAAAPVVLPEPVAWMATPVMQSGRGTTTVFCSDKRMADQWDYGGHPEYGRMLVTGLFTEQQVRALLAQAAIAAAPAHPAEGVQAVEQGEVLVTVSGFTGCGKSAIAGEIEIMCRALGLQVEWPDGDPEKNLTHADWTEALELYKPRVRIVECNVPHPFVKGQDK